MTTGKGVKWGWKVGTVTGLIVAQQYIASHSPAGFFTGSIALVFELLVPLFAVLGAGIGRAFTGRLDGAGN
jgi:hypothetical protein